MPAPVGLLRQEFINRSLLPPPRGSAISSDTHSPVIRCSHVDSRLLASKRSSDLKAEMKASCTASLQSSSQRMNRRDTAIMCGPYVRTNLAHAAWSPALMACTKVATIGFIHQLWVIRPSHGR